MTKETSDQTRSAGEMSLYFERRGKANPGSGFACIGVKGRHQNLPARRSITVFISAVRSVMPLDILV